MKSNPCEEDRETTKDRGQLAVPVTPAHREVHPGVTIDLPTLPTMLRACSILLARNAAQLRVAPVVGLVLFQLACYHNKPTPTSDEFSGTWGRTVDLLEERAPFDLSCSAEQLTYQDLSAATVGVDGCGRRASYKWVSGAGWVMDSASQPDPQ
jgi:hypothetical protein